MSHGFLILSSLNHEQSLLIITFWLCEWFNFYSILTYTCSTFIFCLVLFLIKGKEETSTKVALAVTTLQRYKLNWRGEFCNWFPMMFWKGLFWLAHWWEGGYTYLWKGLENRLFITSLLNTNLVVSANVLVKTWPQALCI